MKKNLIQDERITAQRHKIQSDACGILLIVLLMSILVQEYVFDAPFSQYAAEFACFFGASMYIVIRNIVSGNDLYGTKNSGKKLLVVNSLVTGITVTVIVGISNYIRYSEKFTGGLLFAALAITFACGTFTAFLGLSLVHILNKRRQKKYQKNWTKKKVKFDDINIVISINNIIGYFVNYVIINFI